MSLPLVFFYGSSGLEAQIFESYMASSGYEVRLVSTREKLLGAVKQNPTAIYVLAREQLPHELTELARLVLARGSSSTRAFILTGEQGFDPHLPGVEVVTRPFRLSEVIRRIQGMTKTLKNF